MKETKRVSLYLYETKRLLLCTAVSLACITRVGFGNVWIIYVWIFRVIKTEKTTYPYRRLQMFTEFFLFVISLI